MSTIDRLLGVISVMLKSKENKVSVEARVDVGEFLNKLAEEPVVFKSGINIIKSDTGYKWLSIYSNSFRDDDIVPEIISSESHKEFVTMVDKGTYQLPDLYLWHVPEWKFGEATFVAYDEVEPGVGFAIAGGTIDKGREFVADALLESGEQWQMSHGMPTDRIRRNSEDDTVYDKHVTTEVSVLSEIDAANHLTGFGVLEDTMIPTKKRDEIMKKLDVDEGFLDKLEATNKHVATEAKESREYKEATDTVEEVTETVAETVEAVEETVEETAEAVEEVESLDTEVPTESIIDIQPLMDELAGVKEVIVDLVGAIKMVSDSQKETDEEIVALKKERDDAVIAQTPTFSQFYGAQIKSIIGQPKAEVAEGDKEMTGPPEEKAKNQSGYGSFVDGLVAKSRLS
jgi:hypothetical protein